MQGLKMGVMHKNTTKGSAPTMSEGHSQSSDHHIDKPETTGSKPAKHGDSKIAVIAAIIGNIAVGIVKFIAAFISGSSAMISEGIHSIVDSGNGILVLFGMHRSKKEPDFLHPFGYGKELYFWTLVVALLIFLLGGGLSIYKGIEGIEAAAAGTKVMGDVTLNFVIIFIGMIIEGATLFVAVKEFNKARGNIGPIRFIRDAKDPSLYTVVLEDSAAELGLLTAFISLVVYELTGNLYADGVASLVIGVLLCGVAMILLSETKGLLVGEGMKHTSLDEVREIVEDDDRVLECGRILTMYLGPDSLLITIDATFRGDISAHDVLLAVDDIERKLVNRWPQTARVFIEAESMRNCLEQQDEEESWEDAHEEEYEGERVADEAEDLQDFNELEQAVADALEDATEAARAAEEAAAIAALAAENAAEAKAEAEEILATAQAEGIDPEEIKRQLELEDKQS